MFDRNLMVGTDDRPFQKAPHVLYGVGVDFTPNIFFGTMANCLVPRAPLIPFLLYSSFGWVPYPPVSDALTELQAMAIRPLPQWAFPVNHFLGNVGQPVVNARHTLGNPAACGGERKISPHAMTTSPPLPCPTDTVPIV